MRLFIIAVFAFSFGVVPFPHCASVRAQTAAPAAPGAELTIEQRVGQLTRDFERLQSEAGKNAESLTKLNNAVTVYATWGTALLWVCGVIGAFVTILVAVWQVRQGRKQPAHEEMLKKGEQTISLVNDILDLTKQTTEAAMKKAKDRAERGRNQLDRQVNELMDFANRDNLDVVMKREKNDDLKDLLNELALLDFDNRNLEPPLEVTPPWLFLQALKLSQDHRYNAAIMHWRRIFSTPGASDGLIIRSRYWIGFEQNNLGRFADAENTFEEAATFANGKNVAPARVFELERLCIEARMFRLGEMDADDILLKANELISNIDTLTARCNKGSLYSIEELSQRTRGDILYTSFLHALEKGDKETARKYIKEAINLWRPLKDRKINYAEREFVFACHAAQENMEEARELLEQRVRGETKNLYTNSIRHRDYAYYAMIQLMVAKVQGAGGRAEDMDSRANFHVGQMHVSDHPYSALRKRYVTREQFQADVKRITDKGLPCLA